MKTKLTFSMFVVIVLLGVYTISTIAGALPVYQGYKYNRTLVCQSAYIDKDISTPGYTVVYTYGNCHWTKAKPMTSVNTTNSATSSNDDNTGQDDSTLPRHCNDGHGQDGIKNPHCQ